MASFGYFKFKRPEITQIFKQARRIYKSNELDLLSIPKALPYGRLFIITPKKIGNAPTRNKIKRRLRAIFYENNLFNFDKDFAVIIKKSATALTFDQLQTIIITHITRNANPTAKPDLCSTE